MQSKHLHFDMRQLDPDNTTEVVPGDMIFFKMGPTGAHQLYNHTQEKCIYIDIRTEAGIDICEYPDSGKVNILPANEIYEEKDRVDYFKGEENIKQKWPSAKH